MDGRISILYPDGTREMMEGNIKSKLYVNGIIKTIDHDNGSEETRWPNGQIRIKDSKGRIKLRT